MRACPSGLSLANGISTPIRRICSDCCACKASGHSAPAPTSVMNSRRLMCFPEAKDKQSYRLTAAVMHKMAVNYQTPCPLWVTDIGRDVERDGVEFAVFDFVLCHIRSVHSAASRKSAAASGGCSTSPWHPSSTY